MTATAKTITIDDEAYELLARERGPGQSFSQVIKDRFTHRSTAADLLRLVRGMSLDDETIEAIDEQIRERRGSEARVAQL